MMTDIKLKLVEACHIHLVLKISNLTNIMKELSEAANSDVKNSAGDKHETNRAMIQLEQEKIGNQLKEAEGQLAEFSKQDFSKRNLLIGQGSIIETDKGIFFIACSIGKITFEQCIAFVISHQSPLAMALKGNKEKDTVLFNSISYSIKSIM